MNICRNLLLWADSYTSFPTQLRSIPLLAIFSQSISAELRWFLLYFSHLTYVSEHRRHRNSRLCLLHCRSICFKGIPCELYALYRAVSLTNLFACKLWKFIDWLLEDQKNILLPFFSSPIFSGGKKNHQRMVLWTLHLTTFLKREMAMIQRYDFSAKKTC